MVTNIGLSTSLRTLVNSLDVSQTRLGYLSQNISNLNTEGYVRRTVSQESIVSDGLAIGVDIAEVRRSVDEFLTIANRSQLSKFGESEVINDYFQRIQQFNLGDPNSDFTITNSLNDFNARLDDFANDPSSTVKKSLVINAANNLTSAIARVADGVFDERLNAETEISNTVSELNDLMTSLADLNDAIRRNGSVGGDLNALLDSRDTKIDRLKELIDADISFNEFEQVTISISTTQLVSEAQRYQISYEKLNSVEQIINGNPTDSIVITAIDEFGNLTDNSTTILSSSADEESIDVIPAGRLRGLIDLRDTELKTITDQLDNFVFSFASAFNEIHNDGTGFPPPESLTGTNSFTLDQRLRMSGEFRLSIVDPNGAPVLNDFGRNLLPLTINFDELNGSGNGNGVTTVQSIIDEINSYYNTPRAAEANIGPASDIKLAAVSDNMQSTKATGSISFSSNPVAGETIIINGQSFEFVANGSTTTATQIELGNNLQSTINNAVSKLNLSSDPNVSLATYSASTSILNITYDDSGVTGNGFTIDASGTTSATASGATLSGGANVNGDFVVDFELTNTHPNREDIQFDITSYTLSHGAYTSGVINPTFDTNSITAGERQRTNLSTATAGSLTLNLDDLGAAGLEEGEDFTISAVVQITDASGNISNETVTFTVTAPDPENGIRNTRFSATSVSGSGDGELITTSNSSAYLSASLVDANGTKITNDTTPGFLKISTSEGDYRFSIDQADSSFQGNFAATNANNPDIGKGLSSLFGLNNFFDFGGEKLNASLNIKIRDDIRTNPAGLTSGKAQLKTQTGSEASYAYEMGAGSNNVALELIRLQDQNLSFESAGGLPLLSTNITSYMTEIYNSVSIKSNNAESLFDRNKLLSESLQIKIDDLSGVNLDEELARTIETQNSYSAAARLINVVRELFDTLEQALL